MDPKDPKTRPPIITSRLKQFLSQTPQNQLAKKATLEIPEMVNGKKFNQRRACNMLWDAYGEVISKAIPPSPEAEFERLEMLARGDLDEPPPPRRPRPNTPEAEEDEGQRNIGRVISKINLHWLTAAHRRRLYRTLLIECPKFVELPATETQGSKWKVVYSPLRGSQEATVGELEEFPS